MEEGRASGLSRGLAAGIGRVALPTPPGFPMMGYGARTGTANARHDPLFARALYCENASNRAAADAFLLIEVDVCLVGVEQARVVRDRIASQTALARDQILFGCIHTHSGPDTGLGQALAGRPEPAEVTTLFDAVVAAGLQAVETAAPARAGAGTVAVAPGRNRRVVDGPLEPDALVVRIDRERSSGVEPLAVLYLHGCHPTVLGHDNLAYSADWPGAASRSIEEVIPGAMAMFVLGAHADVDPRTRGLLDLAIPDQSVGESFDVVAGLGQEVGTAVASAAMKIETRSDVSVGAASAMVLLATHGGRDLDAAGRPRHLAALRRDALAALDLPATSEASTSDLYRIGGERTAGMSPEEARARLARVRVYLRDRTAARFAGAAVAEVEVQVLRLGPVWLAALPLEVTVDVGSAWRARASGVGFARVVSIGNGWLRYLPHAEHFAVPRANEQYEVLQSTFEPAAAEALIEQALALQLTLQGSGA